MIDIRCGREEGPTSAQSVNFALRREYPHREPCWGIVGAIVPRAIMIGRGAAGATAVARVVSVVAVTLVATGIKVLVMMDSKPDLAPNPVLRYPRPVPVEIADRVAAIESAPAICANTPGAVARTLRLAGRRDVDDAEGPLRASPLGG